MQGRWLKHLYTRYPLSGAYGKSFEKARRLLVVKFGLNAAPHLLQYASADVAHDYILLRYRLRSISKTQTKGVAFLIRQVFEHITRSVCGRVKNIKITRVLCDGASHSANRKSSSCKTCSAAQAKKERTWPSGEALVCAAEASRALRSAA